LLRGRVKLLEEVRDGVVVLNDRKHTKTRLAVIQQEMSLLTKEKLNLEARLKDFGEVKKLLSS